MNINRQIQTQEQEIKELKNEIIRLKTQLNIALQQQPQSPQQQFPSSSSLHISSLNNNNRHYLTRSASSGGILPFHPNHVLNHNHSNNNQQSPSKSSRRSHHQLPSTPLFEQSRIVKEYEDQKKRRVSRISRESRLVESHDPHNEISPNSSIESADSTIRSSFFRSPHNNSQIYLNSPIGGNDHRSEGYSRGNFTRRTGLTGSSTSHYSTPSSSMEVSSSSSSMNRRSAQPSINLDEELARQLQYGASPSEFEDTSFLSQQGFISSEPFHDDSSPLSSSDEYHGVSSNRRRSSSSNLLNVNNNNTFNDMNSYEQLRQLEDVKVGVKPEILKRLSNIPFQGGKAMISKCSICLNHFSKDETITYLPCLHYYHHSCIMKWFKDNHTCPICKFDLNDDHSLQ